jgi:hypothetical protein
MKSKNLSNKVKFFSGEKQLVKQTGNSLELKVSGRKA